MTKKTATKKKVTVKKELKPVFSFHEGTHTYTLDGRPLTGVTSVLSVVAKPALIGWAAKMVTNFIKDTAVFYKGVYILDDEILKLAQTNHSSKKEDAQKKGTNVHKILEDIIKNSISGNKGVLSEEYMVDGLSGIGKKQVDQFLLWAKEHNVVFLECEKRMYSSSLWLGGTCDFVARVDGKKMVGDIKTTSGVYDLTPFMQCAAYRIMLEEMGMQDIKGSVIVRLGKDGSFEELYRYDYETDKGAFLNALGLYRALATYKK